MMTPASSLRTIQDHVGAFDMPTHSSVTHGIVIGTAYCEMKSYHPRHTLRIRAYSEFMAKQPALVEYIGCGS